MKLNITVSGGSKNINMSETVSNVFSSSVPNKPITPAKPKEEPVAIGVNGVVTNNLRTPKEEEPKKDDILEKVEGEIVEDPNKKKEQLESPFEVHKEYDEELQKKVKEAEAKIAESEELQKKLKEDEAKMADAKEFTVDLVQAIKGMIDQLDSDEKLNEVIKYLYEKKPEAIVEVISNDINVDTSDNIDIYTCEDEDNKGVRLLQFEIKPTVSIKDIPVVLDENIINIAFTIDYIVDIINKDKFSDLDENEDAVYTGFVDYAASTINKKDIEQSCPEEKVLALIGENGNYLTDHFGKIVCVTKVDSRNVSAVSIVSASKLAAMNTANTNESDKPVEPGVGAVQE